jgi:hypothetical protein
MRIHTINGLTVGWDRLMLKSTLWRSIKVYYGSERAKLIMPTSYELKLCAMESEAKLESGEKKAEDDKQEDAEAVKEENEKASEGEANGSDGDIASAPVPEPVKRNLSMNELMEEYDRGIGANLPHGGICERKRIEAKVQHEKENGLLPSLFITKNPMLSMQKGIWIWIWFWFGFWLWFGFGCAFGLC